MKHPRPVVIIALTLGTAMLLAAVGHFAQSVDQEASARLERTRELEGIAKHRFENLRGLTPCDGYAWETLKAARGRLISIGDSDASSLAVVAPTFSEIELVAFGPDYIRTYRFPGQTGFSPPSAEWFSPVPEQLSNVSLTALEQFAISAPIDRHIRYAMTAREYGYDGVSYYFGTGDDGCAFAWSPRGTGPSGLIADIVAEATNKDPSVERLVELARAIDDADSTR